MWWNENEQHELSFLIKTLDEFSKKVRNNLEVVDWKMKRSIFEILIKQVEIEQEKVTVVFRVSPSPTGNKSSHLLEDCRKSGYSGIPY